MKSLFRFAFGALKISTVAGFSCLLLGPGSFPANAQTGPGTALSFDGVNDYVSVPSTSSLNLGRVGNDYALRAGVNRLERLGCGHESLSQVDRRRKLTGGDSQRVFGQHIQEIVVSFRLIGIDRVVHLVPAVEKVIMEIVPDELRP